MGYPVDLVESWKEPIKQHLLENTTKYLGSTTVYYNEETGTFYSEDEISLMSTIPSTDMKLSVRAAETYGSNGRSRVWVMIEFDWDKMPFWRLTDPYGIAWDDSIFRPVDNTASWFVCHTEGKSNQSSCKSGTEIAYSSTSGVGWNADLLSDPGNGFHYNDIWGFGCILLETKSTNKPSGSEQIHGNYAHKKGSGSIGLSFKAVEVVVTGSADSDTRGAYNTFNYAYKER